MVAMTRVPLLAAVLFWNQCGAFMTPSALVARKPPSVARLAGSASSSLASTPTMVLAGLPSKKERKSPWEEDFPTTVGKAAFSSLKDKARDMMVKGAEKRGLDWTGIVESLQV